MGSGGIAAVSQVPDEFEHHFQDTFEAGVYLGNKETIWQVVRAAPEVIDDLKSWGVSFSSSLHLEGGILTGESGMWGIIQVELSLRF